MLTVVTLNLIEPDAVIAQIMNQMNGTTGPPSMAKENTTPMAHAKLR